MGAFGSMTQDGERKDPAGEELPDLASLWNEFTSAGLIVVMAVMTLFSGLIALPVPNHAPSPVTFFYVACSLSLPVLVAIHAAVNGGWRVYVWPFGFLLIDGIALGTILASADNALLVAGMPFFIAIPIVVTLEVLKRTLGDFTKGALSETVFVEGLQFKISHLFIVTAVFAVGIAILQMLAPYLPDSSTHVYFGLAIIVVLLSSNALISVWALLGRKVGFRVVISLLTAIFISSASIYWVNYVERFSSIEEFIFWCCLSCLAWTSSMLQLSLLRRQGYRFVRHSKQDGLSLRNR